MMTTTKLLRITVPAVTAVGVFAAVMLARGSERRTATLARGTEIVASLDGMVATDRSRVGDQVELHTVQPIALEGDAAIAEGTTIRGTVTRVKAGGRINGAPELALSFTELEVDGQAYPITTASFEVKGKSDAKESAAEIGGGAVVGGLLKGVKGAVVGAAVGTGVAVATKGDQLTLMAGQLIRIHLAQPVTVQYRVHAEKAAE
jgi:hypothetical protein